MTPERGFAARWLRLFPFPLKIHFKGRQLPAGRGFFKISFALVIRATGFWQPAGQRIFPFTPHTTALRNLPNGAGSFFWLHLPTTGDFRFCQMDTKKQQIFFRLTAFTGRAGGGWYSVLKVRVGWLDNLGFVLTIFFRIYLRYYN